MSRDPPAFEPHPPQKLPRLAHGPQLPAAADFMQDKDHLQILQQYGPHERQQYLIQVETEQCLDHIVATTGASMAPMHSVRNHYFTLNTTAA